jgi:hypothetical protein
LKPFFSRFCDLEIEQKQKALVVPIIPISNARIGILSSKKSMTTFSTSPEDFPRSHFISHCLQQLTFVASISFFPIENQKHKSQNVEFKSEKFN